MLSYLLASLLAVASLPLTNSIQRSLICRADILVVKYSIHVNVRKSFLIHFTNQAHYLPIVIRLPFSYHYESVQSLGAFVGAT
jgi:hypothetical protein